MLIKKPETLTDSWKYFKTNVTKGWPKGQVAAARDMYFVGACDFGRLIFDCLNDKNISTIAQAAKLKMLQAELEGFKMEIAQSSLRSQMRDKSPEMEDAIEAVRGEAAANMNPDRRGE